MRTHGDVAENVTVTEHSPGSPLRFGLEDNLLINAREALPIKTKQTVQGKTTSPHPTHVVGFTVAVNELNY